jgi:hypothetical protein
MEGKHALKIWKWYKWQEILETKEGNKNMVWNKLLIA